MYTIHMLFHYMDIATIFYFLILIDRLPSYFILKNTLQGIFLNTYLGILGANIFHCFSLTLLLLRFFAFVYILPNLLLALDFVIYMFL